MSYSSRLAEFREMISHIEYVKYTLNSLLFWDKMTYMPPEGIEYRSKVMAFTADEEYRMLSGNRFKNYVEYFDGNRHNDVVTDAMVRRIKRNSEYIRKIPEDEYSEYIRLIAVSEQVWSEARKANDYNIFKPYLEQIVGTFRKFAEYWGYEAAPYDALLSYYEPGVTTSMIDSLVSAIKDELTALIKKEAEMDRNLKPAQTIAADGKTQGRLWHLLLEKIGFSFTAGRVDIGEHPTILANSPSDVRIVNSFEENDIRDGIFNVLHSGGKGIYQQSIDKGLLGTFLAEAPSNTMEESVGRLYENIIGRSRGFWDLVYDEAAEIIPELKGDFDEAFRSVNIHKPSLIRLDADEVTFLIHIIIRYEVERGLLDGSLSVDDLQTVWADKYQEYLGIKPNNDREGVLQDIHWASGYFGYFPTYIISNLAAAQYAAAITRDCGDMDDLVRDGRIGEINKWMKDNVYRYGAVYDSNELLERATGESLDPKYYLDYLKSRTT